MSTPFNLVIYHANCVDGFTAAWAAWKCLGDEDTKYVPFSYGQPLDLPQLGYFEGPPTKVYIVDFSFRRPDLIYLCNCMEQVFVLDHHKTAAEDLTNWTDKPENLYIEFDMFRSGAMIAWNHFHPHADNPRLVDYVQDRDLWQKKLPNTEAITSYIAAYDKTFQEYELLNKDLDTAFRHCIVSGNLLLKQTQNIVQDILKLARPIIFHFDHSASRPESIALGPITGVACNCTGHFASDVGNELCKLGHLFGATWYTEADGSIKFSLRSVSDFDVSWIAKQFGGGGHKNAAGFTLKEWGRDTDKEINLWIGGQDD